MKLNYFVKILQCMNNLLESDFKMESKCNKLVQCIHPLQEMKKKKVKIYLNCLNALLKLVQKGKKEIRRDFRICLRKC